ncbi:alpha/beta hydrolase [Gordonia sp. TBRC 11910]|uniref:Alpha/beta hydrolase n=1 Tax=Gordonia asplenii TaxID=2725283 RepID=A0A848KQM8_9ACTN|nr:alpha/beta hydrolase [Gordonia asplenii]NMO00359.1 alpha/beta hydrolase [Gordonia asplenii]
MTSTDVEYPDASMRYGSRRTQLADVFEPAQTTDSLVLLLHGGFWDESNRMRTWAVGHALAAAGHLTASVAYAHGAGSWEAAFDDVATAIDQIQLSGREWTTRNEAPRKITLVGHSAGGHLALWAASRLSLPSGSRWRPADLQTTGVVALAPVADLAQAARLGVGDGAVAAFLGGAPTDVANAYALADPAALMPSVPVKILHGSADPLVPVDLSRRYAASMKARGVTAVDLTVIDGDPQWGDPTSEAWPSVVAAIDAVTR